MEHALNLLRGLGARRLRCRRGFIPSRLNDPDPTDMIFLPYELLRGDHQLVEVIHDAECGAELDPRGKKCRLRKPIFIISLLSNEVKHTSGTVNFGNWITLRSAAEIRASIPPGIMKSWSVHLH
jgi:hypothetical protein